MQPDIQKQIEELNKKIDGVYASLEKVRKYFFWTLVITAIVLVLPLIAMVFVVPSFINTYTSALSGF